ncbi:MAG: hypothetical protein WCC70_10905 [Candidatus Aquilonibacter sp.]
MRTLIVIAAVFEAITGLVLIIDPSLLGWLLLGTALSASGIAVGRLAGCALLALGASASPRGLLAYNVLAAIFFICLGLRGELVGTLLWPAAAVHAFLAILLGRVVVLSR